MLVTVRGAIDIAADPTAVWAALHDPDFVAPCVPGCREVRAEGAGRFALAARVRLGPVRIVFDGTVEVVDDEVPTRLRLHGRGVAGRAGGAAGCAAVQLSRRRDGTCHLAYAIEAEASGPIAKLGPTMLGGIATALAELFGRRFAAAFGKRLPFARGAASSRCTGPSRAR